MARWRGEPGLVQAGLAEFVATALFVFLGAGTVVVTGALVGEMTPARLVAIAVAHGLAIALLVSATGHISGGHINPAVTLAALATEKISPQRAGLYVVAQLVGAVIGALLLKAVVPGEMEGPLGAHALGQGMTAGTGLVAEIVLTFALVLVIFATAMDPKGPAALAPLAIGLVILVDHLVGVPLTGASMNPARSFGPALVAGQWAHHWIYWVGPAIGGLLAAYTYENLLRRRG